MGSRIAIQPAMAIHRAAPRSFVRVSSLPGTEAAARKAASRAALSGELIRVRKGLYFKTKRTRYGMVRPRAEDVAREVLGSKSGFGPAGFSAARALGVTTQLPSKVHVSALRTVEPIDGVEQHRRTNSLRVNLREREIAVLEVLRAPDNYAEGGIGRIASVIAELVSSDSIRVHALEKAVAREIGTVRKNFQELERHLSKLASQ